jgi:Zn-dependent protease with chaperone function
MKRIVALVPLVASSAFAQCVMCFRTAAAQNAERARVMNMGIIIMVIPPVLILAGFMLLCYKRRNAYADAEAAEPVPVEQELAEALSGSQS